jgi:hypothetical protein
LTQSQFAAHERYPSPWFRPCDWKQAPFGGLLAAPTDGKPVSKFSDPDDAFLEITKTIRVAAGVVQQESPKASASSSMPQPRRTLARDRVTYVCARLSPIAIEINFSMKPSSLWRDFLRIR